ncbi:MAG: hypothetical protein H0X41_00290 [Chitinophagaceae bacterium]|nr:hypothetical protein [Chitinophagaceae bacterium]
MNHKRKWILLVAAVFFWAAQLTAQSKKHNGGIWLPMPAVSADTLMKARWTQEKANAYMERFGAVKGCNYAPRYNGPWWSDFREEIISEELGWAHSIGLNSVRVFVPVYTWQDDKAVFYQRVDRFLEMCQRDSISVMIVFDTYGVKNPARKDKLRIIPDRERTIKPGWHNGPSNAIEGIIPRNDSAHWPVIKTYVQEFAAKYASDKRIIAWDIYNEAWKKDTALMQDMFQWVREVNPSQPLTACWYASRFSDIITYHCYQRPGDRKGKKTLPGFPFFEEEIQHALSFHRPVLCTEWLARPFGNTVQSVLPVYAANNIGWYNWGLVAGSAQFRFPWEWPQGSPEPWIWFHDLLYPDGHPYNRDEIDAIQSFIFCKPDIDKKFGDEQGFWKVYP